MAQGRIGRLLPAVFVTTGNPDSVNDTPVTSTTVGGAYDTSGQLGALFRSADGLREWIYVRYSSTSTGTIGAIGDLCYYISSTATAPASPTWVVDNNTSASNALAFAPAGVLRVVPTRGNYVWLLRKHPYAAVQSTSTVGIYGDSVVGSTTTSPAVIGSTSTVLPAGGIGVSPWYGGPGGSAYIGTVVSSSTAMPTFVNTTATAAFGVNIPIALNIL